MAQKKIYFFKVRMENEIENIKSIFMKLIQEKAIDNGSCKSIDMTLDDNPMHIIMDVFEYKHSRLFGRLSKQKPSNTLIRRNYSTLKGDAVLKNDSAGKLGVEMYTFFLLDYISNTLLIVGTKAAPNEESIKNAFIKYEIPSQIEFVPVPNLDGIERLYSGTNPKVTKLSIEIPKIEPAILEQLFGWKEKELLKFAFDDKLTANLVLTSTDQKYIISSDQGSQRLIEAIRNIRYKLSKASMRGKTEEFRKLRDYNFFEENFYYPINIQTTKIVNGEEKECPIEEVTENYKIKMVESLEKHRNILESFKV